MKTQPDGHDPNASDGRVPFDRPTEAERAEALTRMRESFRNPSAETRAFYAALGERPGATGRDAQGRLVRRRADGSLEVLKE
ncbi:hypothetical protein [Sabulicella glaciei]|uniref:Uncharacterized protein n=1 Tax=Sabulicella glaciei TaxID=2984948 RepID=A0ABT3NZL0_9PROT|nr:hypothetical protein [Roseococcus sp. MDT2-1-1]MCW8087596.1 hypothetical protein [Roseococcus sp. MDT2-1-1]